MDIGKLKKDFPIFSRKINGKPLVYLDNAAASQKPKMVIDAISQYYSRHNANVHRGIHTLSVEATNAFEDAREKIRKFIGAGSREEIIFTTGTTHAINLVASSYCSSLKKGDAILVTEAEHHSNFVPWQIAAKTNNLKLIVAPVSSDGTLKTASIKKLISSRTKVVAITHASNVTGAITRLPEIIRTAHRKGAVVFVDAAQSIPHVRINVRGLDTDFLAFSGHKLLAPTGSGALYGKKKLLEKMPPYQLGGHMIEKVSADKTTFTRLPQKFEAGTASIAQAIGLGIATDYLRTVGYQNVKRQEHLLVEVALKKLLTVPGLRIIGPVKTANRLAVFSFTLDNVPPHDVASLLDTAGIAVRAGHHCAQPLHDRFNIGSSVRASFYFYNTLSDVDLLVRELKRTVKLFK